MPGHHSNAVQLAAGRFSACSDPKGGSSLPPARCRAHLVQHVTDWAPLLAAARLVTESKERVPRFAEQLGRM